MPELAGNEPITNDEVLYRRVSERSGWYDPSSASPVAWVAFRPNAQDVRGLSVWRARYKSPHEAAAFNARPGHRYYILALSAGCLRAMGVEVEPSPEDGGPGHASLVNLSASAYRADKDGVRELASRLAAEAIQAVQGPLGPFDAPDGSTPERADQ